MFIKNNIILKLGENSILVWEGNKFNGVENLNSKLKGKNLYLILEGERIYVKYVNIPKVSSRKLYDIIQFELKYYFHSIEDILFDYVIVENLKTSYKILVFCINSKKIDSLKVNVSKGVNIKKVNLLQFVVLNFIKNQIKNNNYLLVFNYNNNLYFLLVKDGNLLDNSVLENFEGKVDKFYNEIYHLFGLYEIKDIAIYFLWFDYENIIGDIKLSYNCEVIDCDKIKIIESITRNKVFTNWKS
ncbi:hypothetical protein ACER0A_007515 [Haloimpatiens sp. FM7315]|uniref:hypothetical protein n=1 Tax=Haloimpatiens sp. FM7315 TaxID=3298609 RepID=UPI003709F0E5